MNELIRMIQDAQSKLGALHLDMACAQQTETAIEILNHIAQAKRGLALAKDSCMAAQILMDTCGAREIE